MAVADRFERSAGPRPRRLGGRDEDPVAEAEHLGKKAVHVGDVESCLAAGSRVERTLCEQLAPGREAERHFRRLRDAPQPGPQARHLARVEPLGDGEVGLGGLLLVDLECLDAIEREHALILAQVAVADELPRTVPEGDSVRIDVPLGDLPRRLGAIAEVDTLATRHGIGERRQLGSPSGIAGPDDEEPARRGLASGGGALPRDGELAQRVGQIVREGEVPRRERRAGGGIERGRFLGSETRIRQEVGAAIDPVSAEVALVAGRHELDGHPQLEQFGLVALELALRGLARAAVVVGERFAQLGEGDRLARAEQERDEIEQPLGAIQGGLLVIAAATGGQSCSGLSASATGDAGEARSSRAMSPWIALHTSSGFSRKARCPAPPITACVAPGMPRASAAVSAAGIT